ncbi:MAG: DUF1269 domain-containing protein [Deltaproteobacteria bacterium]|nr:DUF1269 domain-containing protein [Deltaproteobacteria bacterium]
MNKFVVVVVSEESKAYEALQALRALHDEGELTLYGTVVARRGAEGKLFIKERNDEGPLGTGVGALTGVLIGALGGPAGIAAGLASGGIVGAVRDVLHADVSEDFLDDIARRIKPGDFAVIAEVSEEWMAPLDTRIQALGGTVIREGRSDFEGEKLRQVAEYRRKEFAQRKAEHASGKAKRMESQLEADLHDAEEKLRRTAEKARYSLAQTRVEAEAKVKALEEQAAKAKPEVRSELQKRIAELRNDYETREGKLRQAYELTQEALSH